MEENTENLSDPYISEKYGLLVEETRQTFFQLESLTTSVDNKAYGMIALDTVLLSMFAFLLTLYSSKFWLYIAPMLLVLSLLCMLYCIKPRKWFGPENKKTIELFKTKKFDEIARILAANYTSYDIVIWKIYNEKFKYLNLGLKLTMISIVVESIVLCYFMFDP
jgi:hypothetical protein